MISNLDYNTALTPLEASHAASTTSDRYGFISTRQILTNLEEHGFTPRTVEICRANKAETKGFQKHVVRLTHEDILPVVDGEGHPEIVLINSHDAKSALIFALGFFKFICSNGVIAGESIYKTRIIHRSINASSVHDAVNRIAGRAPELIDNIQRMKSTKLHPLVEQTFVDEAAKLRWENPSDRVRYFLNAPRRQEDAHNDLWSVFNRVQESLTKGNRYYGVRRITSPSKDVQLNEQIWNLAQHFVN
jgi:hypothetical protein